MDNLYVKEPGSVSRWASFENPLGEKGKAAQTNGGAKGRACQPVPAGDSVTLMDVQGSGIINRIWMTHSAFSSNVMMRSLRIDMYWDGEAKPAVSAPLGDFFGASLGRAVKFESAVLSNPEGRSFVSYFQMPFLKGAKVVLTNESEKKLDALFYDIAYTLCPLDPEKTLYFHAFWNRENPTKLGQNYSILPKLSGEGKFIGSAVGVQADPGYGQTWFGEGEFKVYLDGDGEYPTICGTGTEDYIGSAWGMDHFYHRTQGCLLFNRAAGIYSFYRFHLEDSISFHQDIKVQIQVMGGAGRDDMLKCLDKGLPVKIVHREGDEQLSDKEFMLSKPSFDGGCFLRVDDYSSTAYFYYDKPSSELPLLPPCAERVKDLRS
jgi:hypothetical protein